MDDNLMCAEPIDKLIWKYPWVKYMDLLDILQGKYGHYRSDVKVNGHWVIFMTDDAQIDVRIEPCTGEYKFSVIDLTKKEFN